MYSNMVGGNYLKAQMQNNYVKTRCELTIKEIARRHVHSLAVISKSIQDTRDFLQDVKANSGYCNGIQQFSALYQSNIRTSKAKVRKTAEMTIKSTDLHETRAGHVSPWPGSTKDLRRESSVQWSGDMSKVERGLEDAGKSLYLLGKSDQNSLSSSGGSSAAKNAVRTGRDSGKGDRRDWRLNMDRRDGEEAQGLLKDGKLIQASRQSVSRTVKQRTKHSSGSGVSKLNPQFKESQSTDMETKMFLQAEKTPVSPDKNINAQSTDTQLLRGKANAANPELSGPQPAWIESPPNKRSSATSSESFKKFGLASDISRTRTAPAKASRLQSQSKSERSSTAKSLPAGELKKMKIHVSLSKTERRRILQELISSSTVPVDRSVLERERQRLLQDKINKFFELLFEEYNAGHRSDSEDEDIFFDDETI